MALKATELMIGDLLTTKKAPEIPLKVISIEYSVNLQKYLIWGETLDGTKIGPFFEEEMIPIPLSPKILDKNGWLQNGVTQEVIMECDGENCDDTWVGPTLDAFGRTISVYFDCGVPLFFYGSTIKFLKISCVHELQHAFRLCGLNELAENFTLPENKD